MKIAVDYNLTDVKNFLSSHGYDVQDFQFNESNLNSFDALVVSGQNINFMGIQETSTSTPIINATGLTPQEIFYRIQTINQ